MHSLITENKFFKFIILGILLNLLFLLPIYSFPNTFSNNLLNIFLYQFGTLNISNSSFIFSLVLYILNQIILIISLGGEFSSYLSIYGPYLFTRTNKRKTLIYKKSKSIFYKCILYLLSQFLLTFIIGIIYNFKIINFYMLIKIIFILFLLNIINTYLYVLICNMLSLLLDIKYCFTIILFIEIIILSLAKDTSLVKLSIVKYVPFIQGIFTWHETNLIDNSRFFFNFFIPNFNLTNSFIYNIILITITLIISIVLINRINIL